MRSKEDVMTALGSVRHRRRLLGARAVLTTASVCLFFAALAAATPERASATGSPEVAAYLDPTGDAVDGELDISAVSFDLDRSSGRITLRFTISGFEPASWDGRPRNVQVYVSSRSTQLALLVTGGPQDLQASVGRPTTSPWTLGPLPPSMSFSRNGDVLTWAFGTSELDIADAITFSLYAQMPDSRTNVWRITDRAPQSGSWTYEVADATNVTAVFLRPLTSPSKPVAGKRFTFWVRVKRSDNGGALTTGRMTCDPILAGVVLKHNESFQSGLARVTFVVPKKARGKLLKIRVTIRTGARSATKVATFKVT
jgi:hypothetical protein